MTPVLSAKGVSHSVGGTTVLDGVSLALSAGEISVLVGPNGGGKSTLLRSLLGHVTATGKIDWLGSPLAQWPRRKLARVVAYMPQAATHEPGDRVIDVLRLGRTPYAGLLGLDDVADDAILAEVAERLRLDGLLDRPLDTLSGGQRQRVFLGRALTQQPKALLLDEPATYLDLRHQIELHHIIRDIADTGVAVLMASHDINLGLAHADHAVVLKDGRALASGAVADVLTAPVLTEAFDVPIRAVQDGTRTLLIADASADAI